MQTVFFSALAGTALLSAPALGATLQALYADQTTDQVIFAADKNGDGDANDPGETQVFFDASNRAGLPSPTGNVFTLTQAADGAVFVGDGNTDTVYRLKDRNGDNSAQLRQEASVWFSADNAEGFTLVTPNGLAEGPDGAIYVVEADSRGAPNGDFVYRTEDLNGDGDANDAGESTVWLDLTALNPGSSPFEIVFDGTVAFITDTAGGARRIYRAEDIDGDGAVAASEVTQYVAPSPFAFSIDLAGDTLFALDIIADQILAYTDLNANGIIDAPDEQAVAWDAALIDIEVGAGLFSLAALSPDEILLTSNGSTPEEDALLRLLDLNADGDFLDDGETTRFLWLQEQGTFPVRPRVVIGYESVAPVPALPALPALASALGLLWLRRRP